uniref:Uncharacterized protein n=1 Tax=Ralstonia solanacearum TaxID=305 RepID=A0A0S4WXR2_RALSL|nr:protein of unknown function [Ralstonia solanacearum]
MHDHGDALSAFRAADLLVTFKCIEAVAQVADVAWIAGCRARFRPTPAVPTHRGPDVLAPRLLRR